MRKFRDEEENIITLEELESEYRQLKESGDTESESFEDYIENCTDKNGMLTEVI